MFAREASPGASIVLAITSNLQKQMKSTKEYLKAKQEFLAGKHCAVYPCFPAKEIHHTHGRLKKLLMYKRYWLPVSREGHNWIHLNIAEARKYGWICRKGLWNKQP